TPGYPTQNTDDGARHVIITDGSGNPTLGSIVDAEADGQPSTDAADDDTTTSVILTYGDGAPGDDEDGVSFSPLVLGRTAVVTVTALITGSGGLSGVLNAWMDFDGDGDLTEAGEQIALNETLTAGASIAITFTVPANVTNTIYSRFRFSSDSNLQPTGEASDGEIEDYVQPVIVYDYGDLPEPPYPTTLIQDGARHIILSAGNPTLGATVDAEVDGQPSTDATGDDSSGTPDDEDGVRFESPIVAGQIATLTITGTNVTGALLNAWIDFNGNGDLTDAGEQIFTDETLNAGANVLTISVPAIVLSTTLNSRFRYSTIGGLTPTGEATDGEIEDHQFPSTPIEFGDLPEAPYPTTLSADGARHVVDGVTYLGSLVDAETDGQPSINANGDDTFDGSDDEDGVVFVTPLMRAQTAQIQVTAGSDGYLNGWIDFDGDGTLDVVDVIAIDGTPVISTMTGVFLSTGGHTFTINVPNVVISTSVYNRFRFTSYNPGGGLSYTGLANDGEVEDYVLMSLGNFVWLDDGTGGGTFNDGALNGSEAEIPGVAVELYLSGQTPGVDAPITATATDASGHYTFTGLTPGVYVVHIPASEFGSGGPLEGLFSSTGSGIPDDDSDQEVDENGIDDATPTVNGISSGPVTLSLGSEPTSEDGNANSNLTIDFGFYPQVLLALVKTVTPSTTVPGTPFTYTIRVTNAGQATFAPVTLTDTLPSPDFHYVVGSGSPSAPDVIAEPTLVWQNLGTLAPGESLTVTFAVTVAPPNTGIFTNVATVAGTTLSGTITSPGSTPVTITNPAVQVIKQLAGWNRDDDVITFTIDVINVGPSILDVVPLADDYDYRFLSFADAQPYPPTEVIPAPVGRLSWDDLTGSSNGFNRNLPPGERFVITTVFAIVADITQTVNTAIVSGTVDSYGNLANEVTSTAQVNNIPTGIGLLYLRASGQTDSVLVEWATWFEMDTFGFWLYRAVVDQFAQTGQLVFQPSQGSGSGAEYTYLDKDVELEQPYWYWLIEVGNAGDNTRYGPVSATSSAMNAWHRVYLPVIIKNW
ncbi:MAG: GEVED domain-containing protein, partial [Anaerolineae bacterium]